MLTNRCRISPPPLEIPFCSSPFNSHIQLPRSNLYPTSINVAFPKVIEYYLYVLPVIKFLSHNHE